MHCSLKDNLLITYVRVSRGGVSRCGVSRGLVGRSGVGRCGVGTVGGDDGDQGGEDEDLIG